MSGTTPDPPHPAAEPPDRLLARCEVRFSRRSGPGGQNRNKVETAAILTHRPTGLSAEANERRSQGENRAVALMRLRVNLALEIRRPTDRESGPSPLWRSRLKGGRILVSPRHDDFPALLAEALDELQDADADVKRAADRLGCSASQLVKLLKLEPRALKRVNDRRDELGLRPLL
ncbi:peptide chain release factor family protein [Tautonia plasticadhaerens]|uniref:Peptide chain release factor 1 n=1 Tax=Tautonia plasticadhaerens TaxID=2527974 RepID=A0A518H3T4_9BACT|nr:peptide chain release factor-like protein [Tautonia plasticadhaerens]QDV35468.1 Peptide chain release factor 1 [Tautonia plasticadhaerens]